VSRERQATPNNLLVFPQCINIIIILIVEAPDKKDLYPPKTDGNIDFGLKNWAGKSLTAGYCADPVR
jgi:hypothetical protein